MQPDSEALEAAMAAEEGQLAHEASVGWVGVLESYDCSYIADTLMAATDAQELPADTDMLAADMAAEAAAAADAAAPAQLEEWEAWQAEQSVDWSLALGWVQEYAAPGWEAVDADDASSSDDGSWASDDDEQHPWYHLQWVDYTTVPFAVALPPHCIRLCTCVLG